jgi:hypothetical protein
MLFYRVVQHPVATRLEQEYREKVAAATAALNPLMNENDTDELPEAEATETTSTTPDAATSAASAVVAPRRSNRKRLAPPEFETGEDWARAKTNFPPAIIDGFLKKLPDRCFSDNVVWTKDFIQNILETEASKENARVGKYPKNSISANGKLMTTMTTTTCTTRSKRRWMARQADWMSHQTDWIATLVKIALNEALLLHAPSSCSSSSSSSIVDDLEGGAEAVRVNLLRFFKNLAEICEKHDWLDSLKSYLIKKNEEILSTTTSTTNTKIASSTSTLTGTDEKRVAVVEPEEEMALL